MLATALQYLVPFLLVLSSPSGAGKTSIARRLLETRADVAYSVSATTRPRRPGETDGRDYHFLAAAEFERRVVAGEFLEHATYGGNRYGTLRSEVDAIFRRGKHALLHVLRPDRPPCGERRAAVVIEAPALAAVEDVEIAGDRAVGAAVLVARDLEKDLPERFPFFFRAKDLAQHGSEVLELRVRQRVRQPAVQGNILPLHRGERGFPGEINPARRLLLEDEAVLLADLRRDVGLDGGVAVLGEDLELDQVLDDLEDLQAHALGEVLHEDGWFDMDDLRVTAFLGFGLPGCFGFLLGDEMGERTGRLVLFKKRNGRENRGLRRGRLRIQWRVGAAGGERRECDRHQYRLSNHFHFGSSTGGALRASSSASRR